MKKLGATIYIISPDLYLALNNENMAIKRDGRTIQEYPLHILQDVLVFSYAGASPSFMGACMERHINLCFYTPHGKFLSKVSGMPYGNVLLRQGQYRIADDPARYLPYARNMIFGKVYNSKWLAERMKRDHAMRLDVQKVSGGLTYLKTYLPQIRQVPDDGALRGLEGVSADVYFGLFPDFILGDKSLFVFTGRNRRPPLDPVNALLSFAYSMLASSCTYALETFGLDPYVGFLHRPRAGRKSLALDLMEELRACMADRFVLSMINTRRFSRKDFDFMESGAVFLSESGRNTFFRAWNEKKKTEILHPYLKEKVQWGMVPFVQAQLLSRTIRGDLPEYPAFLWKG